MIDTINNDADMGQRIKVKLLPYGAHYRDTGPIFYELKRIGI